jgi:hypothetical protein
MSQTIDTATVPKRALVNHIVAEARESNNWEEHIGTPRGIDADPEWHIDDVDDWEVDHHSDGRIVLWGTAEAEYNVRVARATRHHPAEYETHTTPIGVEIVADYSENHGLGEYSTRVEGL